MRVRGGWNVTVRWSVSSLSLAGGGRPAVRIHTRPRAGTEMFVEIKQSTLPGRERLPRPARTGDPPSSGGGGGDSERRKGWWRASEAARSETNERECDGETGETWRAGRPKRTGGYRGFAVDEGKTTIRRQKEMWRTAEGRRPEENYFWQAEAHKN